MWNLVPILSRKTYDFSSMSGSVTTDVVLVRALDVVDMRVGELLVRVHAINIMSPGRLNVMAFMTSPSVDSPSTDFVSSSAAADATIHGSSAGALVRVAITAPFGGHLRLIIRAVVASSAQPHTSTLSAALGLREQP
jgi:hypothetical protein